VLSSLKELQGRIGSHNIMVAAAGVAFYGLLALVPTLIALVSIYGLVADPADIEQQVNDIAGSLDESTKGFIEGQLQSIVGDVESERNGDASGSPVGRWFGLVSGIVLALWASSGAVQKLMSTIAVAYEAEEERPGWKVRLLAYGLTAGAIVGVVLMVLVIGVVPNVLDRVNLGSAAELAIQILQLPALALLFTFAVTVLYRYAPDRAPKTPWRNLGSWVATGLFLVFSIAFSIYSANVGAMPASYGLLGSIAALMVFLQLTTLAVVIGAEVNSIREEATAVAGVPVGADGPIPAMALAANGSSSNRTTRAGGAAQPGAATGERLGFGTALAGLVALFVLGRNSGGG
jgi:membrane protein